MNEFTELEKLQRQTGQIIKGKMIENLRANDSVVSGDLLRSIKVENPKGLNKKGNLERANGNIHVKSGKSKFLSYDYDGAISDFSKALEINPREIAAHFNIACAYSLNENIEKALFHLDKAVLYGFDDFEKIKTHDALAFLRVQPEFMLFSNNNFRLSGNNIKNEPLLNTENIEKLEQLRLRGLLTDEEFNVQKMKISRL